MFEVKMFLPFYLHIAQYDNIWSLLTPVAYLWTTSWCFQHNCQL